MDAVGCSAFRPLVFGVFRLPGGLSSSWQVPEMRAGAEQAEQHTKSEEVHQRHVWLVDEKKRQKQGTGGGGVSGPPYPRRRERETTLESE